MKHSEFWEALETVFGSSYGRSLAQDLVVPGLGLTCMEALETGVPPRDVWHALCDEMQVDEADRWVFREDREEPARRARAGGRS